ncbi:MAG: M20/M25/M40 family metallo-hydrolase [Solirubrobacterales bacterium]
MSAADLDLHSRFVALCQMPSATGDERAVADMVADELRALGVPVAEDDAAGPAQAGAGNLRCRIPGTGQGAVMFCAHLDTVPHEHPVEVVCDEGVYRSAGPSILGADNKAAVTVFMELARRWVKTPGAAALELVFTVAEEDGLRGAHAFDVSTLQAPIGYVFDHAASIGEIVTSAPTYHRLRAEFAGVASHAGLEPEAGVSALRAAARAASELPQGRLDPETTANLGRMAGGTATNIIAASAWLDAEARGLDDDRAGAVIQTMVDACNWAAGEEGCDVDVEVTTMFRGYRQKRSDVAVAHAAEALQACGHEPCFVSSGGGSDANAFMDRGLACVNLANGTAAVHTDNESVAVADLDAALRVAELIARSAGQDG